MRVKGDKSVEVWYLVRVGILSVQFTTAGFERFYWLRYCTLHENNNEEK